MFCEVNPAQISVNNWPREQYWISLLIGHASFDVSSQLFLLFIHYCCQQVVKSLNINTKKWLKMAINSLETYICIYIFPNISMIVLWMMHKCMLHSKTKGFDIWINLDLSLLGFLQWFWNQFFALLWMEAMANNTSPENWWLCQDRTTFDLDKIIQKYGIWGFKK